MLLRQAYCPQHLLSSPSAQPQESHKHRQLPAPRGPQDALQTGPSNPRAWFCVLPVLVVCSSSNLLRVHLADLATPALSLLRTLPYSI